MDFDTQPTPGGGVPGDYPGKTKPQQPWIGDIPGKGSEGPTDIPNKDDSCPTCGQPHKGGVRKDNPVQKPQNPLSTPPPHHVGDWNLPKQQPEYRGEQQGRGGHFDAGHQKWQDNIARGQELLNRDFLPGHGGAEASEA